MEHDKPTHPNKYSRSQMIKQGWDDATDGAGYALCEACLDIPIRLTQLDRIV